MCSELMPPLPKGGVFEIEEIISSKRHIATTVSYMYDYHAWQYDLHPVMWPHPVMWLPQFQWEWQDNEHEWRPYGKVENRIIEVNCRLSPYHLPSYMCTLTHTHLSRTRLQHENIQTHTHNIWLQIYVPTQTYMAYIIMHMLDGSHDSRGGECDWLEWKFLHHRLQCNAAGWKCHMASQSLLSTFSLYYYKLLLPYTDQWGHGDNSFHQENCSEHC